MPLNYCLNTLVSRTKKEPTVTFPPIHFMGDKNDMDANTWKNQHLNQQFPQVFTKATITVKNTTTPSANPSMLQQATKSPKEDKTTRLLK